MPPKGDSGEWKLQQTIKIEEKKNNNSNNNWIPQKTETKKRNSIKKMIEPPDYPAVSSCNTRAAATPTRSTSCGWTIVRSSAGRTAPSTLRTPPSTTSFRRTTNFNSRKQQIKKRNNSGTQFRPEAGDGEPLLRRDQSRATTRPAESSPAPETEDRGTSDSSFRLRIRNSNSALALVAVGLRRFLEPLEFDSPGSGKRRRTSEERWWERILKKRDSILISASVRSHVSDREEHLPRGEIPLGRVG